MSHILARGDARRLPLPDGCVHCVVTSPPYWGLRDYGVPGQLGLELRPQDYLTAMLAVFREVRRVLRPDGTLWLNLGDSYTTTGEIGRHDGGGPGRLLGEVQIPRNERKLKIQHGLKPKDLVGMPWRLALALQADGWYLRSEIIWAKPNPMPEPVTDRPTKSHEQVFILSKSERYYYDAEAVREPATDVEYRTTGHLRPGTDALYLQSGDCGIGRYRSGLGSMHGGRTWRNLRSVWSIPTEAYAGAHFAAFPRKLVQPCIKAGSPPGGLVFDPFVGSGTVCVVANALGRHTIGLDLSREYLKLAQNRIERPHCPLPRHGRPEDLPLFACLQDNGNGQEDGSHHPTP